MSKGKRYSKEPKLNIKKVIAVIVLIIVAIMFIFVIKNLLTKDKEKGNITVTSYFPVYTDGKWGVIDSNGDVVIEPSYDEMITIPDNKTDLFICMYDVNYEDNTYKTKVLNAKNKEIFEDYELVEAIDNFDENHNIWYEENVLKVKKDDKYGLINYSGKELLPCEYDEITRMQGIKNSYILKKQDTIGLSDNTGKVIINPIYKEIKAIGKDYKNGYITINEENQYGVIDFTGKVILENKYEDIKNISGDNKYVVKEAGSYKIIGKDGNIIIDSGFDDVVSINGDNIIIKKANQYGVINSAKETKIPVQYEELEYMYSDYYLAKKSGKYGVINLNNEEKLKFEYSSISYIEDADLIEVEKEGQTDTFVYDSNLELKLTGIISEINTEKGYFRIRIGEDYQYYNFKFEEKKASDLLTANNLFLSKKDGKYGYVDKAGNVVVDYIYDDGKEQNSYGFIAVKKDGVWGSLDKNGNIVQEPKYSLIDNYKIDFIGKWHIGEDLNAYYYTNVE